MSDDRGMRRVCGGIGKGIFFTLFLYCALGPITFILGIAGIIYVVGNILYGLKLISRESKLGRMSAYVEEEYIHYTFLVAGVFSIYWLFTGSPQFLNSWIIPFFDNLFYFSSG